MKKTVYTKFAISYVIFAVLGIITISIFTSKFTYKYLTGKKASELYKEATLIANQYGSDYYTGMLTLPQITNQLKTFGTLLNVTIWLTTDSGLIRYDTSNYYKFNTLITDFDSLITPSADAGLYHTGSFGGMLSEDFLSVSAPIAGNFKINGYIIIHMPLSDIRAERDSILNMVYITFFIIIALSLIFLITFTLFVYKPFKKIKKAADVYASGNFKYKFSVPGHDEIATLAATLQYMAHELDKANDYQTKFLANISHDFRSPLTSIKGYLEAMLDGTIPPEMQENYLNIVIHETERLAKLTNDILTINSYGYNGIYLEISTFDINHAIKDVVNTFEGICSKRKIGFELTFSAKTQPVLADMGKIQQVLYNLIDNAVKFSHNNSFIKISVTDQTNKVMVSIKDSGIGIPKDSISKIWDRFYKTDLSRGKDKKGTGLGLSITKEIIQAHSENINVISTEGVGTEFIFTLLKGKSE